jgi:hypothetical protein
MDRLYAQAQMSPGAPQTIAHLVIEQTSTYWILFGIPEVTVRADVVEFKRLSESEHRVRQRTVWEEDD